MLTAIQLHHFKSYKEATLSLNSLTVLIGTNASGKSNAIEGLHLLSWLAQGQKLSSIQYAVQDSEQIVRGRIGHLGYQGANQFTLGCLTSKEWGELNITLALRNDDELHVHDERLIDPDEKFPLYEVAQASQGLSSDLRVAYNNFARGGRKPQIVCSDQFAVFTQLESAARFEAGHKKAQRVIPEITRYYQEQLTGMLFLDPTPAQMREYSFKNDKHLLGSGKNLSSVLYRLWESGEQARQAILDFIRSLPEQDIAELGFLEGPRGEVMVKLTETFGGERREFDATLLSDGTLRVLAIAAAMLSAAEGSLIVIEEIDNGVHPSRANHLMAQIQRIAAERSLRVLLSTHNPALLDALPDSAVPDVMFCYRDPADGSSRLVRLANVPDYPELIAQGTLGHLMTTGILERFVKYHPVGEDRKQRARDWLARVRGEACDE
jgi:predicted ATPase